MQWVPHISEEEPILYLQRVQGLGKEKGAALAFRRGGGTYLGVLVEDDVPRNRVWSAFGIPPSWGPKTLQQWLESQSWRLGNTPSPPRRKNKPWNIQGYVKDKLQDTSHDYELQLDGDQVRHITIKKWQKHRKVEDCERLTGARWWTEEMEAPEVPETQIDATITQAWPDTKMDETSDETVNEKKKAEDSTGDSPLSKKAKTAGPLSAELTKMVSQDVVVDGPRGPGATHAIRLGGKETVVGELWLLA